MSIVSDSIENRSEVLNYQRAKRFLETKLHFGLAICGQFLLMRFLSLKNHFTWFLCSCELVLHLGRHTHLFATFILLIVFVVSGTGNKLYFFQWCLTSPSILGKLYFLF